jgi:hypothetical protein
VCPSGPRPKWTRSSTGGDPAICRRVSAHFAAVTPRGGDDSLAVLAAVDPLDLPNIRLNSGVLQLLNGPKHKPGPKFQIIYSFVPVQASKLFSLCRYQ